MRPSCAPRVRETDPAERQLRRCATASATATASASLEKQTQPKGN